METEGKRKVPRVFVDGKRARERMIGAVLKWGFKRVGGELIKDILGKLVHSIRGSQRITS